MSGQAIKELRAHVFLKPDETSDDYLTVEVSLVAELHGQVVSTDRETHSIGMPRRGIGAIGVSYGEPLDDLPGIDQHLFAHDPERAVTEALDRHHRVRPKDIEDTLRIDLEIDPELRDDDYEEEVDEGSDELTPEEKAGFSPWANLVTGLREVGIDVSADSLIGMAQQHFAVEFDAELSTEMKQTP